MDFVEIQRITGMGLSIILTLNVWGVPVEHMRGQCYDGASNMEGA